jgi:hypothetical protein
MQRIDLTLPCKIKRRDLTPRCIMQRRDLTPRCIMQRRDLTLLHDATGSQTSIQKLHEFEKKIEKNLGYASEFKVGAFDETTTEVENLALLSL